jgi:hypothetical protein
MTRLVLVSVCLFILSRPATAEELRAGAARVDITPPIGHAMWGYAARHDAPSIGVLDPLEARALVLAVGAERIALVSLDLGRAPTRQSTAAIRARVKAAGIQHIFLVASHTHHGPVLELDSWPDPKKPYTRQLEEKITDLILSAAKDLRPARVGVASKEVAFNRNRHSRRADRPADRELLLLRVEDRLIEKETGAPCLFLQGAAGDLSPNPAEGDTPEKFGQALGQLVLALLKQVQCRPIAKPTLAARMEDFHFKSRLDLDNPLINGLVSAAFFRDLVQFYEREYRGGVRPQLTAALLNGNIGFVGVSGEFFCGHSLSLKRRARLEHLFFLGYCNDYQQYFPTIEAASEGGYGTDPFVSPVELGAGERMMDRALIHLYQLRGKLPELKMKAHSRG